ncbi:hypothetical protein LCGC14_2023010, partial [marine sediment metagenome]
MNLPLPNLVSWFAGKPNQRVRLGNRGLFGLFPLTINMEAIQTHLYCVGQSGQGKSKLLQSLLYQMTSTGLGCGVLDPHSDLASDLLAQLASYPRDEPWLSHPANLHRVIYVDPARTDYLIPANILNNPHATSYEVAENVIEAFRRVWPETLAEAPRFAQIMRNAVFVLAESGLSLVELESFLTDRDFRSRLLERITDPLVVSFFDQQYNRWGRDQLIMASPVLNKVSAFLFKPQIRCMLGARENRLDFRRIIDEGKVLIVDLGGFNDEETQRLLGSLLVTNLEQAAFSRRDLAPERRRPFFCMIDEFPLFCSRDQTSLARILSECRKYRLHLGLAHQTISQLPGQRLQGALENAKLRVIFSTGRKTAQAIVGDLFMPDPSLVKHVVDDEGAQERSQKARFDGRTPGVHPRQDESIGSMIGWHCYINPSTA